MQDSNKQTNQSIGCSTEVPIQLVPPKEKNLGDDAIFNNPSMSTGETTNLESETSAQRFQKGILIGSLLPQPPVLGSGGDRSSFPNPAPSANEETNTSKDNGLAAFPKFCAVSNTTPNIAGAVVGDDEKLPPPINNLRKIGIVPTTIPINTPITGGGNKLFTKESTSSFRAVIVGDDDEPTFV